MRQARLRMHDPGRCVCFYDAEICMHTKDRNLCQVDGRVAQSTRWEPDNRCCKGLYPIVAESGRTLSKVMRGDCQARGWSRADGPRTSRRRNSFVRFDRPGQVVCISAALSVVWQGTREALGSSSSPIMHRASANRARPPLAQQEGPLSGNRSN